MKRIICLIIALCFIFGSFSFCFAVDWSSSDQQNLSNAASRLYYMNNSAAYYLYNIASNTNNLYNKAVDIYNALNYSGHTITYWVNAIDTWMQPIYTSITAVPNDLSIIQGLLGYPTNDGGGTTWHPYLNEILSSVNTMVSGTVTAPSTYFDMSVDQNGNIIFNSPVNASNVYGAMLSRLYWLQWLGSMQYNNDLYYDHIAYDYSTVTQNATNWGNLQTSTFTPLSATDGLYKWLSAIQTPVARLSYVLANDQEIEARDAAAANQEAVVDNFINSSGDGATSPSDIGSVSDLSSGYKQNFGSDAQVTGIFNIFNSNNMGWFSQETANQLDTSNNTRKGSSFYTPLLDQQIRDIYDQIGVVND